MRKQEENDGWNAKSRAIWGMSEKTESFGECRLNNETLMHTRQAGNALFLILIAVALFAALSFAVTQSGKGGGNATREQESLSTAQILQYASSIEQAIIRLTLMGGCTVGSDYGGSFSGTLGFDSAQWATPTNYDNPSAPIDNSCDIFDSAGGGVTWQAPPAVAQNQGTSEYLITGSYRIGGVGGDAATDQEALLVAYVTRNMCLEINNRAGITNTGGNPPSGGGSNLAIPGTGITSIGHGYIDGNYIADGGYLPEVYGHPTGCWYSPTNQKYHMYHTLIAR